MARTPIEVLRAQLDQHGPRIAKVVLAHDADENCFSTDVWLVSASGENIAQWSHGLLENNDVLRELKARWASVAEETGGEHYSFLVCIPRRRTATPPRVEPPTP